MKIVTWNVNGIRARKEEVKSFLERERPDVLCMQELKATSSQIPKILAEIAPYWCYWHGTKGYSGVSIHVHKEHCFDRPKFWHPEFDHETRIIVADLGRLSVASIYVPNGGRNYEAKLGFLSALEEYVAAARVLGRSSLLCGDLNVARAEDDVHPQLRDPRMIGQRPEERACIERILARGGLRDVGRDLDPLNESLYSWWAPWQNMRERNVGWRLDYILATPDLAAKATRSTVERETNSSDHGPLIVEFDWV